MTITAVNSSKSKEKFPVIKSCSGKHKTRLLIGEGNFSFALALINKHDKKFGHPPEKSLAHSIIATELKKAMHCSECDEVEEIRALYISLQGKNKPKEESKPKQGAVCNECIAAQQRINQLRAKGAQVELGFDGTKIHKIEKFHGRRFSRIHWNCPHDGSQFQAQTLPAIIKTFFKSCAKVQQPKDRVHMTLAQPLDQKEFYQAYIYDIVQAATCAGYVLLKKRKFDKSRYPEYEHVLTVGVKVHSFHQKRMREFVFQKVGENSFLAAVEKTMDKNDCIPLSALTQELARYSEKKYTAQDEIFKNESRVFFVCSSDEDSSDCEL